MDESGSKTDRRISFSLSAANVKPSTPSSSSSSSSKPWRAKAIFIAVLREGVNGLEGELALDAEGKGFYIVSSSICLQSVELKGGRPLGVSLIPLTVL
jgi:hypothetical protein